MAGTFSTLHTFLTQYYSLEEIHTLCADLQLDYESLSGATKQARARELILWFARRHQLAALLSALESTRPVQFHSAGLSHGVGPLTFDILLDGADSLTQHLRLQEFRRLVHARSRGFVGRHFIFRAIDQKLSDPAFPCGYIHIRGEPGIGKTALMAELVHRHGYMHHFNIASQNIRYPGQFLANICAQLIIHYRLSYRDLPPRAVEDSGFLSTLLEDTTSATGGRPLVILVDALDEAKQEPDHIRQNILYLPPTLPPNVYFIVTSRPQIDLPLRVDRRHDIFLDAADPQNAADIQTYIQQFLGQNQQVMSLRLGEWGIAAADFGQLLAEKSQGNFMYLEYILLDIAGGRLTRQNFSDIRRLPAGLRAYYHEHWRLMQRADLRQFETIYEPIACYLAAAQEAVDIQMLVEWSGLQPRQVKRVLDDWSQFFNVDQDARPPRYRIYHASFQEFLREDIGLTTYHAGIASSLLGDILT